uniref:3-demethylubiquinone-9 3-methyltransferase n=1 Tax=Aureimonas frigidaquae TaxID=424757 RepID=A0A0P0Z1V3_9HYPH|nr:3-demethylubiquinone-9 3-methyltransferase [Aureimonas frigidaquae]
MDGRGFAAPADELVRLAGHGRYDDGDVVAGIDLALDVPRDVPDPIDISDGSAAELEYETRHGTVKNLG